MLSWWLLLLSPAAFSQVENASTEGEEDHALFFLDAMSFAGGDMKHCRLDVFVQVPYEILSFSKQGDLYEASFDLTLAIYDSTSRLVSEKLWTESIKPVPFEQSVSPRMHSLTERVFEVEPGHHFITAVIRDNETKISRRILRQITIPDYSLLPSSMSDIMLVSKLNTVGGKKTIVPTVTSNVGATNEPFYIFLEAYSRENVDSANFVATILDEKRTTVLRVDSSYVIPAGRTPLFMKIDQSMLAIGSYVLFVQEYARKGEGEKSLASTSRTFVVQWTGLPKGIKDLDLAIDQVQYIAKDNELSEMKSAKTLEEKQRRFREFWKSRDTNPNTPRNEKMEEYYGRVEYANKHFSHYQEGWRTDMGMVYILFGSPNNVDRHPFDIDAKPYEVWAYYELNHSFVFVDQTGFGDYRLTTPIWEVWQRPRN